jgi:uncharacterized protein (TIRG00374 family)
MSILKWPLRKKLTLITFLLLAIVIIVGWDQIVKAWVIVGSVNIWIFLLAIPVQLMSYCTTAGITATYLAAKGDLKAISWRRVLRISVESNFVDNIIPVPGAAGFSYTSWMLNRFGVSVSRSITSQIIRYALIFVSFVVVLSVSVIALFFDHAINKILATIAFIIIGVTIGVIVFGLYMLSNHMRIIKMSGWITKIVNKIVSIFTRGKKSQILEPESVDKFFGDIHQDYVEIVKDKKILIKPFLCAMASNILDASLIYVVFLSLNCYVNPALFFVAFGIALIASIFTVTPSGMGAFETLMVGFLITSSNVQADVAIAGTLLARAALFAITTIIGYVFYQLTINKYGKISKPSGF